MTTQQPQIARPTAAVQNNVPQPATQGSAPQQPKPAFIAPAAAPKPAAQKPAAAPKATPAAKKPAAKKAKPAAKKPTPKAAAKPASKPTTASKPSFTFASRPSASNATSAAVTTVQTITAKATENLNDAIASGKQSIQAVVECGNNASAISKSMAAEINKLNSQAIAQGIQAAQKFLACRTASDLINLSNQIMRSQADSTYATGLKLAELATKFTRVGEPLSTYIAGTTQNFTKKFKQ